MKPTADTDLLVLRATTNGKAEHDDFKLGRRHQLRHCEWVRSCATGAYVSRDNGEVVARGWLRSPWFETALKKRLLTMRSTL